MDTIEQLLAILVVLLATTQVVVLVLTAVILLHLRKLTKHWDEILTDSRSILHETSRRLRQGKTLYTIGYWLFSKIKGRPA